MLLKKLGDLGTILGEILIFWHQNNNVKATLYSIKPSACARRH
jgi:hypothetical protein